MVDLAQNHAAAQVSEPRTNSQYHPQNVRGLGEPQKTLPSYARTDTLFDTTVTYTLVS